MKRLISVLLTVIMLLASAPVWAEEVKYNPFDDVPVSHRAYEPITYLYIHKIINGKSKTEFKPEANVLREELAKIISVALDGTLSETKGSFSDVVSGSWYEAFVETCKEAEIYRGISETEFGVGSFVTKQDLAALMLRMSERKVPVRSENTGIAPADLDEADEYAKEAIKTLADRGVIKLKEGEKFSPKANATRAEVCELLFKVLTQADKRWDSDQYFNYEKTVKDDKIAEYMPPPFDVNNYRRAPVASANFDNGDIGEFYEGWCPGEWSLEKGAGVDGSDCIRTEQVSGTITQYQLALNDYNAKPGDWYVFSCKVKCVDLSATTGKVGPMLQIYDSNGTWLGEDRSYANDANMRNNEWVTRQSILMVPEVANSLDDAHEFYKITIQAYLTGLSAGSVAYFDDFELAKILFDPMDTALVTPNYKGLIYGDDGVSDINLRAYMNSYNGGYDLNDLIFETRIIDKDDKVYASSKQENVTDVMEVTYSSNILEMNNDYYLEATVTSKSTGEEMQKQAWTLRKRPEDWRPDIYFDKYNRVIKNGEAVFPLMQYFWSDGIFNYEDMLSLLEERNVDAMSVGDMTRQNYPQLRSQYLREKMIDMGVHSKFGMNGFVFSNMYTGVAPKSVKKQSDLRNIIELCVENFKDDPLLYFYYNFDEQNPIRYGEELKWQNDIMSEIDLNHPSVGCADYLYEGRPGVYAKTVDVIGVDPYVCTGKDNMDLSEAGDRVRMMGELCPNKPQSIILQGFWFKKRGDSRGPTEQEYRNMAWQAVCEGVSMIDNYAITDVTIDPWSGKTYEEIWEEQMLVFDEIRYMTPVILSRLPEPYYEVKGGGEWLNSMSRRYEGKSYLFTVNNEPGSKQCRIYLDGVTDIKGMYSGKEYKANESGWFTVNLDGYEVEIFEYNQEDYKSPHAELIRFGVSNGDHTYTVTDFDAETPVINIDDDAKEIEFLATVSDFAKVYIDGAEVSLSGKINIEGKNSITVKVVSEDTRFESEKTYSVSRGEVNGEEA